MGNGNSKTASDLTGCGTGLPPGEHTSLPRDIPAYEGPVLDTLIAPVSVEMRAHLSGLRAGATLSTSNVDDYYPILAGYLEQGYTLNTFYKVPGAMSRGGLTTQMGLQAIFSRPVGAGIPPASKPKVAGKARLLIETSIIHVELFQEGNPNPMEPVGTSADTFDIFNKIYHQVSLGGRLLCIEVNGEVVSQGLSAVMAGRRADRSCGSPGVGILFESPPQPSPVRYVYRAIHVTIGMKKQFAHCTAQCDWLGTLSSHLKQGWKLVDVLYDQSQQIVFSRKKSMNSIWFFEKEAAKLEDTTPVYEGAVIEYLHKISMGMSGAKVKTDWSPVIMEMGRRGWELACIQATPDANVIGFGKVETKLIMFFQRKIIEQRNVAPPPYRDFEIAGTSKPQQKVPQ